MQTCRRGIQTFSPDRTLAVSLFAVSDCERRTGREPRYSLSVCRYDSRFSWVRFCGSVVTNNVPDGAVAIGALVRPHALYICAVISSAPTLLKHSYRKVVTDEQLREITKRWTAATDSSGEGGIGGKDGV